MNKESLLLGGYIDGLIQQVHIFHVHQIAGFTLVSCAFGRDTLPAITQTLANLIHQLKDGDETRARKTRQF